MAEAIVGAIAPNIFERCVGAAGEHLGYIWNYKKNIANLQTQVEKLKNERDDKRHRVTRAENNMDRIRNIVEDWLKKADEFNKEATQIITDYEEKGKKRCLMGLCPNLVSRYQFSKKASKKETEILEAITEAEKIIEVSDPAIGLGKEYAMPEEGCLTFDSRNLILENIKKTLQDETVNSVGVYGLGGMGKTTLANQVVSLVTKEEMFKEVVFASITQKVDLKEIQGQIASQLDLKLEESTVRERAACIHKRLKAKKVLVILDDLWEILDLQKVGIPFGAEHTGCKVLLTSRFGSVLTSMGTRKDYDLGALKEEEAWKLFEEKVSHIVINPKFLAVGKEIVKKCAGWPILIVTTAASLSKQLDLDIWEDALAKVKNMNDTNMQDIVKSAIKSISYKYLNETHQRLFLLCGLLQGDSTFEDILRYSWGWDLFVKEKVGIVEGARKRLRTLIRDLKESCLLVDGSSSDRIKMHDVVRDIAISIAKDDLKAFSYGDNDTDLSSLPNYDELNKCTAMVFRKCRKLPCFPERLECPSLELFILVAHWVDSKPKIPDSFFERTSKLKVLDMSGLSFPTLPSTLSSLKNLQSLHLDFCDGLQDISMVGELKQLQELSLIGTNIHALPSSLGQLSELKLLDLNRCSKLKVIPAGLISRLYRLEELHMSQSFDRWKSEEFPSNASFVELKRLHYLNCLKVKLQDAKLLAGDLNFENLKRYEIIVGDGWEQSLHYRFKDMEIKTIIALKLGTNSINHLQHVVNTMFKRIECLCLGELKGISNVIPELKKDCFQELKHLSIVTDSDIQYIVDVEGIQPKAASFPALESLYLRGLLKVEKICNGWLMEGSFCKLTIVEVEDCNSLESLFSFSTIIALPCLQDIKVFNCKLLEEIVAKRREEEDDDDVNCASDGNRERMMLTVRRLVLRGLPKFMTFYKDKKIPMAKRRQKLRTSKSEDEMTSSLPLFEEVSFPELEELYLYGMSNLTKIWSHKLREVACCNLTTLEVLECHNLKYLFTLSHARVLVGLQRLAIRDCSKMKQVVAREEGETETETIVFPQLSFIALVGLPKLTTFCSGLVEETTSREKVETVTQPLFDEKVQFPSLKTLVIKNLDSIRAIWPNPVDITKSLKKDSCEINLKDKLQEIPIFQNLSEVKIKKCVSLKFVFSASVSQSLNQMTKVCVEDCGVETTIGDREDVELEKLETGTTTFTLPKLVKIELKGLPKLECFYPKEHTLEWPALKELVVVDCDKLYVLDLLRCSGKQGDDRIVEVIPSLKSLGIGSKELSTLLELADLNIFDRLEDLRVTECPRLINLVPLSVCFRLPKRLEISDCGGLLNLLQPSTGKNLEQLTDPNVFNRLEDLCVKKCPRLINLAPLSISFRLLKRLKISDCGGLTNLLQPSTAKNLEQLTDPNVFDRLEDLRVKKCPRLINLAPLSISFRLLKRLEILNCDGLTNLLQSSAAKNLEQLERLTIRECEVIVEIIGGEVRDDDKESSSSCREDEITFNKLIHLSLEGLPSLTHFCSSQYYTFNFPKLRYVFIIECPNMKTFCGGIVITPQLNEVCFTSPFRPPFPDRGVYSWEGELNTTVKKINDREATKQSAIPFQEERAAGTCEKSKGKEIMVYKQAVEHFEKSETSRFSDPSCSNHTASSSQSSPQISNQPDEVSDRATQVDAHTPVATVSTTLPGNQFEAQTKVLENKESKVCENATTGPRKEAETCDQVVETEAQGPTVTLPSTSSSGQFEQEAERQDKSIEKSTEPTKEGRISKHVIHDLGTGKSLAASSSQQKDWKGSRVAKDSISLSEFVHILQTQPANNVSAEQVEFVEDAVGLFCTYVNKAKECLERKKAISKLKLQIEALEDENDVVASAAPRFG